MKSSWLRRIGIVGVFAWVVSAPVGAQATRTDGPAPTPRIEQRYERVPKAPEIRRVSLSFDDQDFFYARPILRIGQGYTLKAGDTIRDVRSVLGNVTIDGRVARDVVVVMGDVTVGSSAVIEGSLVVAGGSAKVAAGARVGRDFVVIGGTAETPPDFSPGQEHVVIGSPMLGDWLRTLVPWLTRGLLLGRLIVPDMPWVWAVVGIGFFIGFLMNQLFSRQVSATAATLTRRPITAFFVGLLVLLLMAPILALVAATVIGLAVVPFCIAALIVGGFIGKIGVARVIGRSIVSVDDPETRLQGMRSFVLGVAIITVAYMIPILGILTWALVGVFGLGAATMSFAATLKRERPAQPPKQPVVTPPPAPPPPVFEPSVPPAPSPIFSQPPASAFTAVDPPIAAPPQPQPSAVAPDPGPVGEMALFPRASFLDRLAAFTIDVILIAVVNAILGDPWGPGGRLLLVVVLYQITFIAWKGTTLGGIVCNLRVVRTSGADLRPIESMVRGLSSILSAAALGIGCLWMINDAEQQMWHDKIAGSIVVKVPRELVLA